MLMTTIMIRIVAIVKKIDTHGKFSSSTNRRSNSSYDNTTDSHFSNNGSNTGEY